MMADVATLLLELRGVVEADPERVAEILLDARPGGRSPLAAQGELVGDGPDGDSFVVKQSGSRLTVTVDRAARCVAVQGGWWYRSETSVGAERRGSSLIHRVFDVAERQPWAVRFVSRGPLLAAEGAFAEHLYAIGEQLGCAAYPVQ